MALSLSRRGKVVTYDRAPRQLEQSFVGDSIASIHGELTDTVHLAQILRQFRPSVIVHLAAMTGIMACARSPEESFRTNVYGTYSLARAITDAELGAKLIFASSREVYGETADDPTSEEDPCVPNNVYGMTKLLGEQVIKWVSSKLGVPYTILRFTNLYGPGGDKYAPCVFIRRALRGEDIEIMGGDQIVNLVYIDDAVRALEVCMDTTDADREAFNLGSEESMTVRDLVALIVKLIGTDVTLKQVPMRDTETRHFIPDLQKIRGVLGFRTSIGLEEGLRRTIAYCSKG